MINISTTLPTEKPFIISLKATTKEGVIKELVEYLFDQQPVRKGEAVSGGDVCDAILKREYDFATGIGQGLAFPHARIEGWGDLAVVAGVSQRGIDFSSVDQKPAYCIFLMISSVKEPYVILQTMSAVLRHIEGRIDMEEIAKGNITVDDVSRLFESVAVDPLEKILAGHIACPISTWVTMDTSIKELSRIMHESRSDILPVVDKNGIFCGEVSSLDVFRVGIPDFFKELKTISFIKYLDPFDKLFNLKQDLTVADICRKDLPPLTKDNTLMEIVFEMTAKNRAKLFVINDDGTLAGVIDRFTIIDKILFY